MHRLAEEYAGRVAVWQLDAAEAPNARLMEQYEVRGHPTIVTLDADGRVVERLPGLPDEDRLRAALEALLD